MKTRSALGTALFAASLAVGVSACNDNPPVSQPGTAAWISVTELVSYCDYPAPCAGGAGFRVMADGTYDDGHGGSGRITSSELSALRSAADAVASQDLGVTPNCRNDAAPPGASEYTLALTRGDTPITITERSAAQLCVLGDEARAFVLHDRMSALEHVYDPPAVQPRTSPLPFPSPGAPGAR